MRYLRYILPLILVLIVGAGLHYALPQVDVVQIVGTDVRRVDDEKKTVTNDVFFIQTTTQDGKATRVYRNEDNWLFFKFDTADLQAKVKALAEKKTADGEKVLVAIRHYGWRIPIFSSFPNAVGVKEVDKDYVHWPIFNAIVIIVLIAIVFFVRRWFLRLFGGRPRTRAPEPAPTPAAPPPPAPTPAPPPASTAAPTSTSSSGDDGVDDWLNDDGKGR